MYDFLRFPGFKDKAVTLSYDDGVIFDKKLIGILDKYGLKCTFNINSGYFEEHEGKRHFTPSAAAAFYKDCGHEVGVHGIKHLSLPKHPDSVVVNEIVGDRKYLEELFSRIITGMAYANGAYDDRTAKLLKFCGIDYARTTVATERFVIPSDWLRAPVTCHHNHPRLMELVDAFLEDGKPSYMYTYEPKLFYLWGHSSEYAENDNWEIIENFAAKIATRNDIWHATNGEVFRYCQAYNRLVFSVSGDIIYNPSAQDVYLDYNGKHTVVPAGQSTTIK